MKRFAKWLAGFFEVKAAQSMTRVVMLLGILVGAYVAHAVVVLSERPHLTETHVDGIKALTAVIAIFVVQLVAAVILRTKGDTPTDPPPPEAP